MVMVKGYSPRERQGPREQRQAKRQQGGHAGRSPHAASPHLTATSNNHHNLPAFEGETRYREFPASEQGSGADASDSEKIRKCYGAASTKTEAPSAVPPPGGSAGVRGGAMLLTIRTLSQRTSRRRPVLSGKRDGCRFRVLRRAGPAGAPSGAQNMGRGSRRYSVKAHSNFRSGWRRLRDPATPGQSIDPFSLPFRHPVLSRVPPHSACGHTPLGAGPIYIRYAACEPAARSPGGWL